MIFRKRKKAEEKLKKLAVTDFLTSVNNRAGFQKELEKEINRASRHNTKLTMIMIDLDYFKKINDTYGHDAGDEVLIQFSKLVISNFRDIDTAGRIGGEEFAVIMPETSINEGKKAAERLKNIIENKVVKYEPLK